MQARTLPAGRGVTLWRWAWPKQVPHAARRVLCQPEVAISILQRMLLGEPVLLLGLPVLVGQPVAMREATATMLLGLSVLLQSRMRGCVLPARVWWVPLLLLRWPKLPARALYVAQPLLLLR